MFNQHNGPISAPPGPSGPEVPQLPALRTFRVTRYVFSKASDEDPDEETLLLNAHGIMVSEGDRTIFQTWRLDPVLGPQLQVSRILVSVVDLEDVTPEVSDSRILH